jgi:hypothetical protein
MHRDRAVWLGTPLLTDVHQMLTSLTTPQACTSIRLDQ